MQVVRLYISPGHNYVGHHGRSAGEHPVLEVPEIECLAGRGIVGDRYLDHRADYKGQITFFSLEVHEELRRRFGRTDRDPAVYRRNVVTRGVDLNGMVGRSFEVQGVRFEGVEPCKPCYWMDQAFGPGAEAALEGRGGLRAKILSDGRLRVGALPVNESVDAPWTGVVLAGGGSTRMGRDKAWLEKDGETLLARQLRVLREAGASRLLISGREGVDYSAFGVPVVVDRCRGVGPLGGLASVLSAAETDRVLVLAVDVPRISPALLRMLGARSAPGCGVVPRVRGNLEPLVAVYPRGAASSAEAALAEGRLAMRAWVETLAGSGLVSVLDLTPWAGEFDNWNTPEDLLAKPDLGGSDRAS